MTSLLELLLRLDSSFFHGVNRLAGRSPVSDWFCRLGADDHIIPVALTLMVLLTVLLAEKRRGRQTAFNCVLCAFFASLLSMGFLLFLNRLFFRPRPFTTQAVNLLLYRNTDSAFPSNAATLAFVLAFAVLLHKKGLGSVMACLAAFLGFARVMAGVHYPSDVLGGALLGLSCALLARSAEPVYRPLSALLTELEYCVLASWRNPSRVHGGGRLK